MVVFDIPRHYNSMDGEYQATEETPLAEMEVQNIGISTLPTADQTQQLKGRIFQGASRVELGFSGRGKGSLQGSNTTPEMYGKDERQDIRELAKLNEIKLSTHASYNIGTLSGLGQGGFDDNAREATLREIQRAIDFAGDTAGGGAVVVHTGEFPRSIHEWYKEEGFTAFEEEEDKAVIHLVDRLNGKVIESIRKDQEVFWPVWEKDKDGNYKKDKWGNFIPVYDKDTHEFKIDKMTWKDFENYADMYNKHELKPNEKPITAAQAFYRASLDSRRQYALAWGIENAKRYEDLQDRKKKFEKTLEFYEELEKNIPEEEKWKIKQQIQFDRLVPPDIKDPTEYLRDSIRDIETNIKYSQEMSASQMQQAKEMEYTAERAVPIEDYGIERAAKTIAQAAEFAYNKSKTLETRGQLKAPIFVAPENIFPEQYGAHPQELKNLILEARETFVKRNKTRFGESKAKQLAENHIKATFDVGHAYTWRKYFEGDPNKTMEENDKDFNNWLFKQVDMLNKSGVIGEVHVSDNFGWEDEHVTPGQGKAPIKEFVDRMKKAGLKDLIVEPAHQDYRAMLGGWREFGAPVYGAAPNQQKWSDIQFSYFGRTRRPYFVFGDYAPSQDFTLWSQVPME
jgi:sugar phosphate isomerase/epimerase